MSVYQQRRALNLMYLLLIFLFSKRLPFRHFTLNQAENAYRHKILQLKLANAKFNLLVR